MKSAPTWLLWGCLPIFNTLNQAALKMTAGAVIHEAFGLQWLFDAAMSPYIWMSFACEIINFVVWMTILKRHNVSQAFPLTAISYATIMITGWLVFHEPMQWAQLIGIAMIMGGIAMLGFSPKPSSPDDGGDRA